METVFILGGLLVAAFVGYGMINGSRNNDPMNRKCASELCHYFVNADIPDSDEIYGIFRSNARYKTQANHVLSMDPIILMKAGCPKDAAISTVPFMRMAIMQLSE